MDRLSTVPIPSILVVFFTVLALLGCVGSTSDLTDVDKESYHAPRHQGPGPMSHCILEPSSTPTLRDAERMVKQAHATMAVMNRKRLDYAHTKRRDLDEDLYQGHSLPIIKHGEGDPSKGCGGYDMGKSIEGFRYCIPRQVAEAARIVAEASPLPLPSDYGVDIAQISNRYRGSSSPDTNAPPQKHQASSGLRPSSASAIGPQTTVEAQSTEFWMTAIEQRGSSPFAPAGYKVHPSHTN